ncbi:MAG: type II secretion system GspH family protein [Heliobacteriaceae bacterium]|jgi:prepilin-type N-terminal cleavage/methylation domain-containing protein|nr:type II secretion system GspH family protein [Heliobacteriaceae bacterium]
MKYAFTLAEVLITLGIIGVAAALTMPSLIAKYEEKAAVTALKKFSSTFGQLFIKRNYETGEDFRLVLSQYGTTNNDALEEWFNLNLKPYLNVVKQGQVGTVVYSQCPVGGGFAFFLSDGMCAGIDDYSKTQSVNEFGVNTDDDDSVLGLFVDINGMKRPNKYGRDRFMFVYDSKGLHPAGMDNPKVCNAATLQYCTSKMIQDGKITY